LVDLQVGLPPAPPIAPRVVLAVALPVVPLVAPLPGSRLGLPIVPPVGLQTALPIGRLALVSTDRSFAGLMAQILARSSG